MGRAALVLLLLIGVGCTGTSEMPVFKTKFLKTGMDNDLGEFIDAHTDEDIRLDLQWERGAFNGGTEGEFQFFVLFDSCAEPLEKGEKPDVGNCHGTEYNVPKPGGKPLLAEDGGVWRLRGVFAAGERSGPKQGLFAVELTPAE